MKFHGRTDELKLMEHLYALSPSFLVLTGSRLMVGCAGETGSISSPSLKERILRLRSRTRHSPAPGHIPFSPHYKQNSPPCRASPTRSRSASLHGGLRMSQSSGKRGLLYGAWGDAGAELIQCNIKSISQKKSSFQVFNQR